MQDITIYHNPNCGTSRNTLALIRHVNGDILHGLSLLKLILIYSFH